MRCRLTRNDRRERLIKTSRDVTALSKKLIFHLHRFSLASGWPGDASRTQNARLLHEAHAKLDEIYAVLMSCAEAEALVSTTNRPSPTMLRFERFLGGSLEELVGLAHTSHQIEAAAFLYFLEHDTLMPLAHVQAPLRSMAHPFVGAARLTQLVYITPTRYLLGLSDVTGELMRFAINAVGATDAPAILERVVGMQRAIYSGTKKNHPSFSRQHSSLLRRSRTTSARSSTCRLHRYARSKMLPTRCACAAPSTAIRLSCKKWCGARSSQAMQMNRSFKTQAQAPSQPCA